ncbi:hypothetical protein [Streptomyces sirii]|uniref:hypothetical protein n=1 Tax=Streptomyces sirii TaxID=3127701 RepID=UPI003D368E0A
MADTSAMYGLLGALGGAGVTGIAAIYGPLRLQRHQAGLKAAEEQVRQREKEIARLLKMRTMGRVWIDALERIVQDLQAHRPLEVDRFDEITSQAVLEAYKAGHDLVHDGIWLESTSTPPRGIPALATSSVGADGSTEVAASQILGRLRVATEALRADVLRRSMGEEIPVRDETLEALELARAARAQLNATILEQIELINGDRALLP